MAGSRTKKQKIEKKEICKVLCFYLPQFHETVENSKWWGEGYTEWTAVKNAKPYFRGHGQPKIPLNENYYDLSDPSAKTWKWQSKLAGKCGIGGFVIYHYWFAGRKMLEKPVEILLAHPEININYSFCWDNNEWKRTWYSEVPEVLIPQDYGDEDIWERHFNDLLPYFNDERYIKVDNKPLFHVYASRKIGCLDQMKACWDRLARENGYAGIYLVGGDLVDRKYQPCLDAYYNFEPNRIQVESKYAKGLGLLIKLSDGIRKRINRLFRKQSVDKRYTPLLYKLLVYESEETRLKTYRGLYVDYDDTPRRQEKGVVYIGGSSALFQKTLRDLLMISIREDKEFLYINAWNEWGEGAYLEPDQENQYAYLEAVKRACEDTEL